MQQTQSDESEQIDQFEDAHKEASLEYAQFFNEMNWLKAISPNLTFKPFVKQGEEQ
jgi:hypothetical protein